MYDYFLPPAIKNFVDSIFEGPIQFLNQGYSYLSKVGTIAGHGINLNNYFGFFSYLPGPLQAVINSLIAGIVLLAILQLVKSFMRMYYALKDGAKWW
ncbi:hypothetical protein D1872_156660 [compost metagenome]